MTRRPRAASTVRGLAGGLAAIVVLGACTPKATAPASSSAPGRATTVTATRTPTLSVGPTAPVATGPTSAVSAASCPYLAKQSTADRVGMRLDRIAVLRSGGKTVGCRFYALQNSPLHVSEHLPGPNQPAVEITTTRYASSVAAHNAFVRIAQRGTNPQQETFGDQILGVCFQIDFYPRDRGRDWACGFSIATTAVLIRTVVTSPALTAVLVARAVTLKL